MNQLNVSGGDLHGAGRAGLPAVPPGAVWDEGRPGDTAAPYGPAASR